MIMKILTTILTSFLSLYLTAQNVTLTFAGANNNRNYQVVIDGNSYYSNNTTANNGRKMVTISNLTPGSHSLEVYEVGNNNSTYSNGAMNAPVSGESIYSKTFQTRTGYDMNIAVRPNGLVSFSEKRGKKQQQYGSQGRVPMSSTSFNQLYQNVRAKRYQSEKISLVKTAFNTTSNNFTSSQVRQLLLLVNAENSRLELAKLAYLKVTDPNNFTTVYDVLNTEANRDALDDYVVLKGGSSTTTVNTATADNNAAYTNRVAMSDASFNQLLQKVQGHFFQSNRIEEVKNALNTSNNYFSTAQLRQLLSVIANEGERLALTKLAYARASDPYNFNQLGELFSSQASRDELNNYIITNGGAVNSNTGYNNSTSYSNRTAMSDASFNQLYQKASNHFFQSSVVTDVKNAFSTSTEYFSTEQVKQLLLLVKSETDRLALAKLAYAKASDPGNFSQLSSVFTTQANKDALIAYIRTQQQ